MPPGRYSSIFGNSQKKKKSYKERRSQVKGDLGPAPIKVQMPQGPRLTLYRTPHNGDWTIRLGLRVSGVNNEFRSGTITKPGNLVQEFLPQLRDQVKKAAGTNISEREWNYLLKQLQEKMDEIAQFKPWPKRAKLFGRY